MARILKTNTAVRIVVGPFVDLADATTLETGLTVTGLTMNLISESDAGSAPTKRIDAVSPTASSGDNDMVAIQGGYYDLEITATQVNFVGRAKFGIYDADVIAPYFEEWIVVAANVYDALMGTDKLQVHADEITNALITAAAIADGAIDNATLAADIGSTAYASNIIALAVRKVLDELNLDHLMKVAVASGSDMTTEVPDGTVLSNILTIAGDTSDYARTVHSLEQLAEVLVNHNVSIANFTAYIENKRGLRKTDSVWYLYIRNGSDEVDILCKALKDKDGNNITDIQAGAIAIELASSV
jgi:hypothetical protein